jgi:hypothetical protein
VVEPVVLRGTLAEEPRACRPRPALSDVFFEEVIPPVKASPPVGLITSSSSLTHALVEGVAGAKQFCCTLTAKKTQPESPQVRTWNGYRSGISAHKEGYPRPAAALASLHCTACGGAAPTAVERRAAGSARFHRL